VIIAAFFHLDPTCVTTYRNFAADQSNQSSLVKRRLLMTPDQLLRTIAEITASNG
jgi:hypothetical protein